MRYLPVAAVALLAAVFACAMPGSSEYHQGAPGTVAPPVRPGHGAPVVGQPGTLVRPLPRSPHKRFIPKTTQQEQEDGIWAGDQPKAVAPPQDGTSAPGLLAFWAESLGSDDKALLKPNNALRLCERSLGERLDAAIGVRGLRKDALALCLVARGMERCLKFYASDPPKGPDALVRHAKDVAHRFPAAEACAGVDLDDLAAMEATINAGWPAPLGGAK